MDLNKTFENNSLNNVSVISDFQLAVTSILAILGCTGNLIILIVIHKSKLREQTATFWLTILAASDSVFLCQLLCSYFIDNKFLTFVSYFTCELGAWCIFLFVIDRYVGITHPLHHDVICTDRRSKIFATILIVICGSINSLVLFDSDMIDSGNFDFMDTVLSFLIPLVFIMILNVCSVVELSTSARRLQGRVRLRDRVVMAMVVVSIVFAVFRMPEYTLRIAFVGKQVPQNWVTPRQISQNLFHSSFAINFLLYCASWVNFRKSLLQTFRWIRRK